jgi:hypothetical protein
MEIYLLVLDFSGTWALCLQVLVLSDTAQCGIEEAGEKVICSELTAPPGSWHPEQLTSFRTWALSKICAWFCFCRQWDLLLPQGVGPLSTMSFTAQAAVCLNFPMDPHHTLSCSMTNSHDCLPPRHCVWVS